MCKMHIEVFKFLFHPPESHLRLDEIVLLGDLTEHI